MLLSLLLRLAMHVSQAAIIVETFEGILRLNEGCRQCRLMGAELIATYLLIALLYLFMHDPEKSGSAPLSLAKAVLV